MPGSSASYPLAGCLPIHPMGPCCQVVGCRVQGRRQTLAFKSFAELKPELEGFSFKRLLVLKVPSLLLPFERQVNPNHPSWDSCKICLQVCSCPWACPVACFVHTEGRSWTAGKRKTALLCVAVPESLWKQLSAVSGGSQGRYLLSRAGWLQCC